MFVKRTPAQTSKTCAVFVRRRSRRVALEGRGRAPAEIVELDAHVDLHARREHEERSEDRVLSARVRLLSLAVLVGEIGRERRGGRGARALLAVERRVAAGEGGLLRERRRPGGRTARRGASATGRQSPARAP